MRGWKLTAILLMMLVFATGCWNMKEIQDISYVAALGFDYEDRKFIVHVQLLDFSSVAKLGGQQKMTESPIWVGTGTGESFTEAINNLYETAQQRMFWGHVSAIVFSERILKEKKYRDVLDSLDRYREIRYLVWTFSTKESIKKILSTTPFFYESPMMSILHTPVEPYEQHSIIPPIQLFQFIRLMNEASRMSYLPELRLQDNQWEVRGKAHSMLEFAGISVFGEDQFKGDLTLDDLQGLPWMNEHTVRAPLSVERDHSPAAVLVLEKPKVKIKPSVQNRRVYFDVEVTLKAGINELYQDLTEKELMDLANRKLEEQIRHTYRKGFEHSVDIYQLSEPLYRWHPSAFHQLEDEHHFVLHEDSLRHVRLNVRLAYTGRYKLKPNRT